MKCIILLLLNETFTVFYDEKKMKTSRRKMKQRENVANTILNIPLFYCHLRFFSNFFAPPPLQQAFPNSGQV
jgi:hypothetical protein